MFFLLSLNHNFLNLLPLPSTSMTCLLPIEPPIHSTGVSLKKSGIELLVATSSKMNITTHWYESGAASALPAKTTQLGNENMRFRIPPQMIWISEPLKYHFMFSLCNCNILSEIKSHQNCIAYLSLWSVACASAEFVPRELLNLHTSHQIYVAKYVSASQINHSILVCCVYFIIIHIIG